ncbi:MAG: sulfatase-like hydrolase/transferase, partial [Acidimicrobiaceae bacterium]|nr:sulfatase-like hydrolase/transferase [Acidimicrobiaceae bacterium]
WAQCGNSPFKWYKQNTHEGGVHVPLVVHWPEGIAAAERGTMRHQFVNVSDVVPTVYELLGVTPPEVYKGLEQMPVTGHSFAPVLHDADHPATNTLQYFEMSGSRALVAGSWKAVCRHIVGDDFDTEQWELYDLSVDWSECDDLAARRPEKLAELIELWWSEAERNGVLPLDDSWVGMFSPRLDDRSPHPVHRRYRYRPPMSPIAVATAAAPGGRSFALDARVTRAVGDEGVIWATGTASAGVSMFVQGNRLVVDYNAFGDHTVLESGTEVPAGDATLSMRLKRTSRDTGTLEIAIDGAECGRCDLPVFMGIISAVGTSIGRDYGSAVSDRYVGPFGFSGTLHEVEIQLAPRTRRDNVNTARAEMARQ